MKMRNQYRLGAMLSYGMTVLNILITLFYTPFILRMIGTDQQGIYNTIGSMVSNIAVLDLGLGNAVIRYVAKYRAEGKREEMSRFLGMVLSVYLVIGAIVLVIGGGIYVNLGNFFTNYTPDMLAIARPMFLLLLFNATLSMVMNVFPAVLSGYEQFVTRNALSIGRVVVRAVLLPVLLLAGGNVLTIAVLDTSLSVALTLFYFAYSVFKLKVRIRFGRVDVKLFKEVARYSSFIFLNMLMEQMYWSTDAIIIGKFYVPSVVLISTYGTQIAQYFIQFSGALSNLFLPRATQMAVHGESREAMTDLMIRVGRIQLMLCALIAIGFTCVGRQFFMCWLGDEMGAQAVTQCYIIALMLVWALMIPMFENTGIAIVQALNRHAFRSIVLCAIAALNVVASVFLAKAWGPIGAAIGTAVSLLVGNVGIINWYYWKRVGLNIPRFFRQTLKGILPAAIVCGAVGALTLCMPQDGWLTLAARACVIVAAYVPLMFWIGMNDEERGEVRRLLQRRRRAE